MKFLSLILICLFSVISQAESLGKEVQVSTFEGRLDLNVVYGLGADPLLYMVFAVDSAALSADRKINSLSVALYDSVNKVFIRNWEETTYAGEIVNGSLGLNLEAQASAKVLGPAIKNLKVLFSVNNGRNNTATHFLDVGVLCNSHPDLFGDFESEKRGCPQ